MFKLAAKCSLNGEHPQHRLGAVIVKGGSVLATGYNQLRYTKQFRKPTLHAEADAILKVLKGQNQHLLVGSDIYVSRFTRGGAIGMAAPCASCMSLIASVGIKNVYYTTDDGTTEKYKVVG